jgi:glycine/D-amino acid oxidase-like deaminating enzyme
MSGERLWSNSGESLEAAPSLSPESARFFELDPTMRRGPERVDAAAPQRIDPSRQREVTQALGRTAVAGQQRAPREQRREATEALGRTAVAGQQRGQQERSEQTPAPLINRTAIPERRETNQETVTRQLGYKALERNRVRPDQPDR